MRFRRKRKSKKKQQEVPASTDDGGTESGPTADGEDKQPTEESPPLPAGDVESEGIPGSTTTSEEPPEDTPEESPPVTSNGDMKAGSVAVEESVTKTQTSQTEKKTSKLAAFSKIFKPWKWRKRKKTSEKIEKTAVDLERKISVRTSREELIKRGVLKEVDEYGQPIVAKDTVYEEDEDEDLAQQNQEAVKDSKSDSDEPSSCDYKQANGSAASTPTLPTHPVDGHLHNSIMGMCDDDDDDGGVTPQTLPPSDNTISLSPDYHPLPPNNAMAPSGVNFRNYSDNGHVHRPESTGVEPKQIRVMFPVEDKDRHISVIQKAIQIPVVHEPSSYSSLPSHGHHTPPIVSHSQTLPVSSIGNSQTLNNNIYTPTGLTYPTPTIKGQVTVTQPSAYSPTTPTGPRGIEEVPMSEPDLSKKPIRSALKGAKSKELLQRQLQQKLQEKQRQLQFQESVTTSVGVRGYGQNGSLPRAPPKVAPKPRFGLINAARVTDPHNKENLEFYDNIPDYDNLHSDDSDDEVQYDDRDRESILAAKVQRQDSLARFLSLRPERRVLIERNILPVRTDHDRQVERDMIGNKLTRRLSLRPSAEELEHRNILLRKTADEIKQEKEEMKRVLIRKLSFRPTVDDLKERKIIKFSDYVEVTDSSEYDRRADKPWTRLTPKDKAAIRKELNEFKSAEMDVHDKSRHLTRFHRP